MGFSRFKATSRSVSKTTHIFDDLSRHFSNTQGENKVTDLGKKYLEKRAIELYKLPEKELKEMGEKGKDKKLEEEEKELKGIRDKYWVKQKM